MASTNRLSTVRVLAPQPPRRRVDGSRRLLLVVE
jgi:hypothetical protein